MKKFGIHICFAFVMLCLVVGKGTAEYNIATQKNEMVFISTEKEISMGRSVAAAIEKHFGVVKDERMLERVEEIAHKTCWCGGAQ